MSINASVLIAPLIDLLVGKIITAGTGNAPAKIVARAQEVIAVNNAIVQINSGSAAGIAALQTALSTSSLDPGEALALQSLFSAISTQLAALSTIAGSTLTGQMGTEILDSIVAAGTVAAQAYVTKYGATS